MKTETKLKWIACLSGKDFNKQFNCLMHHVNMESLLENFNSLDGKKAVGIDGISKEKYRGNLIDNLNDLHERMKRMAYKPGPVRETLIPKEGIPGKFRPLGISNLEDKIIQRSFQQILESIYEPLFLDCSYGFRAGRSCHTAIRDLKDYLYKNEIETVIDIDLENFFGTIDHKILENFLREKIKDERFIRYIIRMFKAGVLKEGDLTVTDEGVPQGSICSPILANIFAHYVLDEWVEETIQPYCRGKVKLFRYADDAIICCEHQEDALNIERTLPKRLDKYNLKLNEKKTKRVSFSKRKARLGIKQGTFDFLGFTFYLGRSRNNKVIPKLQTSRKTMGNKLKKVKEWSKKMRNRARLKDIWRTFGAKIRGHIQYYGVSFNFERVDLFVRKATKILYKWLNRRSQKRSFNWEKFNLFMRQNPLPKTKIYHSLF